MNTFCGICGSFTTIDVSGRCNKCGGAIWQGADPFFVSGPVGVRAERSIIPVGEVLADRFRVSEFLGSGRSSLLYLCLDVLSRQHVVLKVAESTDDESAALHLMRERQVHGQVREYSHILRSMDIHSCNWNGRNLIFLSSEFADGGTLREWLEKHSGDAYSRSFQGLRWLKEAMKGLRSLHRAGIVHLDLSPENIFLVAGAAKVGDLGACILSDRRFIESAKLQTSAPADWGTPEYMSPEQFRARDASEVDARANVYSVGVVLFELLHPQCRRPFDGSFDRLRDLHLSTAPPALPEVAEELSQIVMRCLEKNPSNRFQGADELLDALKAATSLVQKSATEATRITSSVVDARPTADLWRQCIETHGSGRLGEAMSLCKEILNQQPVHPEAAGMLKELEHRYEQTTAAYEAIRRDIGRRNARDLAELFLKFQGYPDHPLRLLVAEELDQTFTRAKRLTDEASAASGSGDFNEALNLYRLAHNVDPNPVIQCSIDLCKQLIESNSRIQALRDSFDPNSR